MPLQSALAGVELGKLECEVTARQVLAYAAVVGALDAVYLDDTRPEGIVAFPLFGVRLDWPLRPYHAAEAGLTAEEIRSAVHASQDMHFHRPIRPGDRLTTAGRVIAVEQRRPGAYAVTRYETTDAAGAPVLTTYHGYLFRGVACAGGDRVVEQPPALPVVAPEPAELCWQATLPIERALPYTYTECTDIWNPIHTERSAALAAGLPDVILHGTATLALGVRDLLAREAGGDPARLARVCCRFGAMVRPGSTVQVNCSAVVDEGDERLVAFSVLNEAGEPAVQQGVAVLRR